MKLRFVNRSLERRPPNVVVWQRNDGPDATSTPVAWRLIRRCGYEWSHPFDFSDELQVRVHRQGGSGRLIPAAPGNRIRLWTDSAGRSQFEAVKAEDPSIIEIHNLADRGAIATEIWRDGRPLAIQPRILPGIAAPFRFPPTLILSAVSGIEAGDPLTDDCWLGMATELDLRGVVRSEILMIGGGPGPSSAPLTFHLTNVETWLR